MRFNFPLPVKAVNEGPGCGPEGPAVGGRLRFSENGPQDITFEVDIRGAAAPELRAGDVARVRVNGNLTLRGVFRGH